MTGLGGSSGVGPSSSSNKGTYDFGGGGLFGSDISTHSAASYATQCRRTCRLEFVLGTELARPLNLVSLSPPTGFKRVKICIVRMHVLCM